MSNRATNILALLAVMFAALMWSRSTRESAMNASSRETSNSRAELEVESSAPVSTLAEGGFEEPEPARPGSAGTISEAVLPRPAPVALAAAESLPAGPESENATQSVSLPPLTSLENLRSTLRQYSSRFGGNPVGDNAEITAALNGGNARRAVLLNTEDGIRFNSRGELIDVWNTPYFFHQLSRTEMEIRSGGPDRRMWTADDLVIR